MDDMDKTDGSLVVTAPRLDDRLEHDKEMIRGILAALADAATKAKLLHAQDALITIKDKLDRLLYELDEIQAGISRFAPRAAEAKGESTIRSYIRHLVMGHDRPITVHERVALREMIFANFGKNCQDKRILNILIQLRDEDRQPASLPSRIIDAAASTRI